MCTQTIFSALDFVTAWVIAKNKASVVRKSKGISQKGILCMLVASVPGKFNICPVLPVQLKHANKEGLVLRLCELRLCACISKVLSFRILSNVNLLLHTLHSGNVEEIDRIKQFLDGIPKVNMYIKV